jgi:hypothetical protein
VTVWEVKRTGGLDESSRRTVARLHKRGTRLKGVSGINSIRLEAWGIRVAIPAHTHGTTTPLTLAKDIIQTICAACAHVGLPSTVATRDNTPCCFCASRAGTVIQDVDTYCVAEQIAVHVRCLTRCPSVSCLTRNRLAQAAARSAATPNTMLASSSPTHAVALRRQDLGQRGVAVLICSIQQRCCSSYGSRRCKVVIDQTGNRRSEDGEEDVL